MILKGLWCDTGNIDLEKTEFCYKILSIEDKEKLEIKMENQKLFHKMLGYSRFTQEDPRYNKKYADYDILLLQINSNGKNVVWGDVGIGNFFISKQSLQDIFSLLRLKFSNKCFKLKACPNA